MPKKANSEQIQNQGLGFQNALVNVPVRSRVAIRRVCIALATVAQGACLSQGEFCLTWTGSVSTDGKEQRGVEHGEQLPVRERKTFSKEAPDS